MSKKEIRVCYCGNPLTWTFAFPYKEYVCLNCGRTEGMLGARIPITKELIYKAKLDKKIWKVIYNKCGFLPTGSYTIKNCKKCDIEDHNNHLSKSEIIKDKIAKDFFDKITK